MADSNRLRLYQRRREGGRGREALKSPDALSVPGSVGRPLCTEASFELVDGLYGSPELFEADVDVRYWT